MFTCCSHCGDEFTEGDGEEGMIVVCFQSHLPVHKRCELHPTPLEGDIERESDDIKFVGGI